MLHCARNTNCDVELRCDHFACLSDLHFIWAISRVNCCSRRPDRCVSKGISQLINKVEILFIFQTSASRNDDPCSGQLWSAAITSLLLDKLGFGLVLAYLDLDYRIPRHSFDLFERRSTKC